MSFYDIKTGMIYRNPKPHIKSINAYFPSVVELENGEMVATIRLGEAFEAHDLASYIIRSTDYGDNWELEGRICDRTKDRKTTDSARLMAYNGELYAFMIRQDRHRSEYGLTNPENTGYVEQELMIVKSYDKGHTWSAPKIFSPAIEGPAFEICCPIVPLSNGNWVIPTSTWQGWDGYCPNGLKMIGLVSKDGGESWPEYVDIMNDKEQNIIYWESKVLEIKKDVVLAVAWGYDNTNKVDMDNQYAISYDGAKTFTKPMSTHLRGQTLTPLILDDGRILCVYRRMDKQGLWANISKIEGEEWINEEEICLWGGTYNGLVATSDNMSKNFSKLKFGAPSLIKMTTGEIFVSFWAVEDCVSNIRYFKFKIK